MQEVQRNVSGYSLLESLIAIGLAALFLAAGVSFVISSNLASAEGVMRQRAIWASEEGLGALRTIAFDDLSVTSTGALSFASNEWALTGDGPESLDGGFTRTVRVIEAERDASCDLVSSGGTTDPDTYMLESEVTWTDLKGETQTLTTRSVRTNWENPSGSCFAADCSLLTWDVLNAAWSGGKQLRNIYIENTTGETKVVDKITITWDYPHEIQQVFFDNGKVWSASGPGSPAGTQPSGTELDIENADVINGDIVEMHKTQFTQNMEGSTISITYECDDGSVITFGPFTPTY